MGIAGAFSLLSYSPAGACEGRTGEGPCRHVWLAASAYAGGCPATVLAAGGVGYRIFMTTPPPDNGAVADIESLDKNHDLIIDTDLVNELTGAPSDDVAEP